MQNIYSNNDSSSKKTQSSVALSAPQKERKAMNTHLMSETVPQYIEKVQFLVQNLITGTDALSKYYIFSI